MGRVSSIISAPLRWLRAAILLALAIGSLWCVGAFLHAFLIPRWAAVAGTAAVLLLWGAGVVAAFVTSRRVSWLLILADIVFQSAVLCAFLTISPEERFRDTVWQKPWSKVLEVHRREDGKTELRNVRDFLYRSENDYDVRYTTIVVDPKEISSIDAAFSHWDDLEAIAHSMLGLNFRDGTTVVISLETRLPEGATQNPIDGFYRRYGLAMIAGTPNDLYGLRADHRGEALFVYRLDFQPEILRTLVNSVFSHAEKMRKKPQFYNSLFRNCTTGLLPLLPGSERSFAGDIRVLMNGMAAKMLFENGMLFHRDGERFDSLRSRCLVPGRCSGAEAPREPYRGTSEASFLRRR